MSSGLPSILQSIRRWIEDLLFPLRMRLGRKIMWTSQRRVVQLSRGTLVKGPVSAQEVDAMRYVAAHCVDVCLPAVQRTYQRRDGVYLAMDFVRGESVERTWPTLDGDERRKLVESIWQQFEALRSVIKPKRLEQLAICSASGGSVYDGIVSTSPLGPFTTYSSFRKECLDGNPNFGLYQHLINRPPNEKEPVSVFSHADLGARNIILRARDGRPCIIDWEFAGWWPAWWEYVKWHFTDFPELPGWVQMMDEVSGTGKWHGK